MPELTWHCITNRPDRRRDLAETRVAHLPMIAIDCYIGEILSDAARAGRLEFFPGGNNVNSGGFGFSAQGRTVPGHH